MLPGRVGEQKRLLLSVVAIVGLLDQAGKAWAWRNLAEVHVNSGGDLLVGSAISGWFRDRAVGAAFDVLDAALLVSAGMLLVRRRRSPALLIGGAFVLAGWVSNLGDRLGLHFWTAPGSMRGVVDFVPWDGRYWNLADAAIVIGSVIFALALSWRLLQALATRPRGGRCRAIRRPLLRYPGWSGLLLVPVLVAAAVLAGVGATGYSGLTTPPVFVAINS
jgi:Lipoprotein signal peptidase